VYIDRHNNILGFKPHTSNDRCWYYGPGTEKFFAILIFYFFIAVLTDLSRIWEELYRVQIVLFPLG